MNMLNNMTPNPSRLRIWAERNYNNSGSVDQNPYQLNNISSSVLWLITRFNTRANDNIPWPAYSDDYALFEWGAHVYSCILAWNEEYSKTNEKDDAPQYLIDEFIRHYERETGIVNIQSLLENRFLLYGYINGYNQAGGAKRSANKFLASLIQRSSSERVLSTYSRIDYRLNDDFEDSLTLMHSIIINKRILPHIYKLLESHYTESAPHGS